MDNLKFIFLASSWDAIVSIKEMRMLTEYTETSIYRALEEVNQAGAVKNEVVEGEYDEENHFHYEIFYYAGITGDSVNEVKIEYSYLISQMFRRAAFMNIFGLFEYHLEKCFGLMVNLSNHPVNTIPKKIQNSILLKTHWILTEVINKGTDNVVLDVDHMRVIRNFMVHNNGVLTGYHTILKKTKRTEKEESILNAVGRFKDVGGLTVSKLNGINTDERFLGYAVQEFERYFSEMKGAIEAYNQHKK